LANKEKALNEQPIRQLKLRIADFVIEARCADPDTGLKIPPEDKAFIVKEGQPDCIINVHHGPFPDIVLEHQISDTGGGSWQLYDSGQKLVFQMSGTDSTHTLSYIHRIAIFEPDFSQGDLFICPKNTLPIGSTISPEKERKSLNPYVYPLDELLIINLLALRNGLHIHALGVVHEGRALVFCGVSGAGKSTMAELWKKRPVRLLSDDRISLRKKDGKIWAYGTPWHGDARVSLPEKAPLEAIYFLVQSQENKILPLSATEVATRILVRCFPTFYFKQGMEHSLSFIDELTQEIPCFELQFTPDQRAVDEVLNHAKSDKPRGK
jgi:hypothetical protein